MSVEVTDDREHGCYRITEDGERVGLLSYRLQGPVIDFLHAEVDPDHGGRGLAGIMVRAALDDAGDRGLQVLPHCPYVGTFVEHHRDQYLDLVPEDRRAEFGLDA